MKALEIVIRSIVFNIAFVGITFFMIMLTLPTIFLPREKMFFVIRLWVNTVYWLEKTIIGLDYEVRGIENIPKDQSFIVAAKHQSAYETMKLHILFDDPAVVLKRELLRIPLWGRYLQKIDPIAIDRSNKDQAIKSLLAGVDHVREQKRPIVIFPQGTRVRWNATPQEKPYKIGVARMQESSGLPIIPMALNSGIFWPRNSWIKRPGRVIFEFLPSIQPQKSAAETIKNIEKILEAHSTALIQESQAKYTYLPKA